MSIELSSKGISQPMVCLWNKKKRTVVAEPGIGQNTFFDPGTYFDDLVGMTKNNDNTQ